VGFALFIGDHLNLGKANFDIKAGKLP
jgi:hypothetical protein